MDRRLNQIFQMIPKAGKGIIDVGTDHGCIPIQLALHEYPGTLIASDIATGPLNTAREAAKRAGVASRIEFIQCDGLSLCEPDQIDCIVIAGMGGDTICSILDQAEWLFSEEYYLVLQPMTRAEVLRYWLVHNDYKIVREAVICDSPHVYQIFCAAPGKSSSYTDVEYLIGDMSMKREGDSIDELIVQQRIMLGKKLRGLVNTEIETPTALFYKNIKNQLEQFRTNTCALL